MPSRLLALCLLLFLNAALARGEEINADALGALDLFARSFCAEHLPLRPEAEQAGASTEMAGFLRRLADLGVRDAVAFDADIYASALIALTARRFDPARSCRLQIWTDLRPVIVPTAR